jgi:hypothetical protein
MNYMPRDLRGPLTSMNFMPTPSSVEKSESSLPNDLETEGRPSTRHHSSMFRGVEALTVLQKAHRSLGITQLADALQLSNRPPTIWPPPCARLGSSIRIRRRGAIAVSPENLSIFCI